MSCDDTEDLVLGGDLGTLRVKIVPGVAKVLSAVLMIDTGTLDVNGDPIGTPVAWPAAPVLKFGEALPATAALQVDATLSTYTDPDLVATPNALATWTLTAEQSATLADYLPALVSVSGEIWYFGIVVCLS